MKCRCGISLLLAVSVIAAHACSSGRKLAAAKKNEVKAGLRLPEDDLAGMQDPGERLKQAQRDTLVVKDPDGNDVYIMSAVKDEDTGEMVATEQLVAAVVTARFRNVAERFGKVDLEFQIVVPEALRDSKWQLVFHPKLYFPADSMELDDVIITGKDFRKSQLRGYQQYQKFIDRIVTDSLMLTDTRNLEIFLERNFSGVVRFRTDSSFVSDEEFESSSGVSVKEVVEHYRNHHVIRRNMRLLARQEKMRQKYVRNPIVTEGVRLDTVFSAGGDFVYNYIQTIAAGPGLRKVDLRLNGEISDQDSRLYDIPESEKLTFYISSLSSFAVEKEKYLSMIVCRNLDLTRTGHIGFRSGSAEIEEDLASNASELEKVKLTLRELAMDEKFEIDSIVVSANASPEGNMKYNNALSAERAESAAAFLNAYMEHFNDSLRRAAGLFVQVDDSCSEGEMETGSPVGSRDVSFLHRSGGENWRELAILVEADSLMSASDKDSFRKLMEEIEDQDKREATMKKMPYYGYMREKLYPSLRTVDFVFCLHRAGMVKDTVHTSVLDSVYMNGVQALKNREYERALALLSPYKDINAAVAMIAMDRNLSALNLLETMQRDASVNYLLALAHSRLGNERLAVECFLLACRLDRTYVSRGNLDPEISVLIKKYSLDSDF